MLISRQALAKLAAPVLGAVTLSAILVDSSAASAQGLFDSLFGDRHASTAAQTVPALPFNDPSTPSLTPAMGSGRVVSYCVRLCDGRFFPIHRHSGATPVQTCNALCPAAKTKIFSGSEIAHASASDGARYVNLANAFLYRQKMIDGCTCNGKDAFGLAAFDIAEDTTLRAGDLVATEDGLQKFTGSQAQLRKGNGFTPATLGEASSQRRKVATTGAATPN